MLMTWLLCFFLQSKQGRLKSTANEANVMYATPLRPDNKWTTTAQAQGTINHHTIQQQSGQTKINHRTLNAFDSRNG